ncbi:site-specific integrase [Sphingomonas sp. TZW2008]|uniref:site-specific integrase n=1 Tax=Sphingomonas sp. TZW2008 TaxID=1917973 RepID=UPI00211A3228|nr:site-specific integrase [Sphingomonas sp. TZW2008]
MLFSGRLYAANFRRQSVLRTTEEQTAPILQNLKPDDEASSDFAVSVIAPAEIALRPATVLLPGIVDEEIERADSYARAARSTNTHRAYVTDWEIFTGWCAERGECPLPATAELVRRFVSWDADRGRNPATINRRVAAIGYFHKLHDYVRPTEQSGAGKLRETMAGIRNACKKPKARKDAADAAILEAMIDSFPGDELRARRDRAVLAIGMAAALRRSELVALTLGDIAIVAEGLRITIGRSKTDQAQEGAAIAVPEGSRIRPKERLLGWIEAVKVREAGTDRSNEAWAAMPLFRRLTRQDTLTEDPMSDRAVARLVQAAARKTGLDERKFAGHSLRAGFLTESAARGATIFKMQEVSRHKSVQVLSDYVRSASLFKDHAGSGFL